MASSHRLQQRNGTWYYYRRVPQSFVTAAKRDVIKVSLRTKDKAEAAKLRSIQDVQWDAFFASLAKPGQIPPAPPMKAISAAQTASVLSYIRAAVQKDDLRHAKMMSDGVEEPGHLQEMRQEAEHALAVLTTPGDPERDQMIYHFQSDVLKKAGVQTAPESSVEDTWRRGLIEIYRRKLRRYDDDFSESSFDALFSPTAAQEGTRVDELLTTYLEEITNSGSINGISSGYIGKKAAILGVIRESFGADAAVATIDDEAVQRYRMQVATMPANRNKVLPGKSLQEAVDQAQAKGLKTLAPLTQTVYLDTLRDVLKLAVRKKWLAHNPAADIQPIKKDTVALSDKRPPFTDAQIVGFFNSEFYQSCAPGSSKPYQGKDKDWRFWLPLLMLLSGARPNEIAQLSVTNVKVSGLGTSYLDLLGEGESGILLKTDSSKRRIPLHRELIKIGFWEFVQRRKSIDGDSASLFPGLKPNKLGNRAWYASRRFNEKFLPDAISIGARQALYSLRHNVRDALRRVEAPPQALQAITGWSDTGGNAVSDNYGDPFNPDHYVKWVNLISYKGLNLSFLHQPAVPDEIIVA